MLEKNILRCIFLFTNLLCYGKMYLGDEYKVEIIIGKTAGFCFGVKNAINNVIDELNVNKKVFCLGELVHNTQITEELKKKGAKFIDNIEEAKKSVIIRAHGIPKNIYKKAQELNLEIKDLTCPKVLHIHNIAEEFSKKNYFIFLVGQKEHPETIGTISFCGEKSIIIETIQDVEKAVNIFKQTTSKNALVIAQTTYSINKFNEICEKLQKNITNIEIKNTICNATKMRQEETKKIAQEVNAMVIIGGKHSSNSNKLYEIAKKYCNKVLFVETKENLDINLLKNEEKIGVMAGASTPKKSIQEIVDIIKKTC